MITRLIIFLLCGLTFGVGLAISGMTDTRIVIGFLDVAGEWNPALLAVMVGALTVTVPGFWLLRKKSAPILATDFHLPTKSAIDWKILGGSTLFGVGWGLYGYCPGPALASLLTLDWQPTVFVLAMSAGMLIESILGKRTQVNS